MTVQQLNLPLTLTLSEVYPFLGMTEKDLTPDLKELLDRALQKVNRLAQPKGAYGEFVVEQITPDKLTLQGTKLQIQGSQTMGHFTFCRRVTFLAVTIGQQIAQAIEELSHTKISEALLLDAAASAATENLAEQLDALITGEIRRKGFYPTARFSPGYGDWQLTWQKELIFSLDGEKIGLGVTPHNLLTPIKSITAAIGWSTQPVTRNYELPNRNKPCQGTVSCQHCPLSASCPSSQTAK